MSREVKVPCWTVVAGVVVQAESFKDMSRKVGASYSALYQAHHRYPGTQAIVVGKRTFNIGVHDAKPDDGGQVRKSASLLLPGYQTHGLGVVRR